MHDNNHTPKTTAAFLIGALAGGITALLFAPQSGMQTRRKLKRGAQDLYHKGENLAHGVEETVKEKAGAVRGAVSEAKHTYRDELDKRRAPAAPAMTVTKTRTGTQP